MILGALLGPAKHRRVAAALGGHFCRSDRACDEESCSQCGVKAVTPPKIAELCAT